MSTPATSDRSVCVVLFSDCDGVLTESAATGVEKRLRVSSDGDLAICRPKGAGSAAEEIQRFVQRTKADRLLIAGCRTGTAKPLILTVAGATGLPVAHVRHVSIHAKSRPLPSESALSEDEHIVAIATKQVQRGIRALESIGEIETAELPLDHNVVVLGDDECAKRAAAECSRFGFKTTLISALDIQNGDSEYELVTGATETESAGFAGSFEVAVKTGTNGGTTRALFPCGAIIDARRPVASDLQKTELSSLLSGHTDSDQIVYLESLEATVGALPRTPRERTIAIVLDLNTDETKASTALACRAALAIQRDRAFQVHLLCRHARVASPEIGDLYDRAREAGVAVLKYDKKPVFARAAESNSVEIRCFDTVLKVQVSLACDVVAVSRHGMANLLSEGYVNNLHFAPANSSVPGYFLAGAATGERYAPDALGEAVAAAIEVRKLLSPEKLEVELSSATVDEEKCAICLTCIRTCPHLAMRVHAEKNIAENLPQSCQRCGICVGVCPARAISLPEFSEEVLFALLD